MKPAILVLLIANLAGIVFLIVRPLPTAPPVEKWPEIEPDPEVSFTYRAELVRVIDGDTVVLNVDLGFETWMHNQTIRLYGIDTPEMRGEEKPEGEKAKEWLQERLYGREIVLQSIQDKKGSFGRWLGILFTDGENVNEELVSAGMAERL